MTQKASFRTGVYSAVAFSLLLGASAANAEDAQTAENAQGASGPAAGIALPRNVNVYALTSDNAIYLLKSHAAAYVRLGRVNLADGGNLIGIDFRPADETRTKLYGLSDTGRLYKIDVSKAGFGESTLISTMRPRFTGGFGGLMDFNPVLNALRVAGSNDQNIAVLNDGGNLGTTVVQTPFAYASGDVSFGKDPEIVGGAYSNNFVGAENTLFYVVDHDLDTLVTIASKTSTGSSNTGSGQLQTIGPLVDESGNRLNLSAATDFDIFTDANGVNYLVGQSARSLFSIDLSQIDPDLPLGTTQQVVVKRAAAVGQPGSSAALTGSAFDIAMPPRR